MSGMSDRALQTHEEMEAEALEAWEIGLKDAISPNGLMLLLDMAVQGRADIDPREIVGLMLDDVVDSVTMAANAACRSVDAKADGGTPADVFAESVAYETVATVRDYVDRAYGELTP